MAELADALDSGSNRGNSVEVQVLLSAPRKTSTLCVLVFLFRCERGLEKGGGALRRKQSPSGVLLSLRFPTRRNIYREDCRKNRKSEPFLDRRRVRIFCFRRRAPPHNKSIRSAWPGCFSSGAVRCGCLFFRPRPTHHCAALAVSGSATSLKAGASAGSGRPTVFHSSRAVWARFSGMATPSGSRAFSCCSET